MNRPDANVLIVEWAANQVGGGLPGQFDATESGAQWRKLAEAFHKLGHHDAARKAIDRAQAIEAYLAKRADEIIEEQREKNKNIPWMDYGKK